MKINEKIAKLDEKILKKEIALEEKKKAAAKLKDEIKRLEKSIENIRTEAERLRYAEVIELMQSKAITAEALKQAIMSGSAVKPLPEEHKESISQEEKINDISNS